MRRLRGPVVDLIRFPEFANSTFGMLIYRSFRRATVELPWHDDKPNISCISLGLHQCFYAWSPRHGRDVYHVLDPRRSGVEIDIANWSSELRGCMALGRKVVRFNGRPGRTWGVCNSGSSRRAFHRIMRGRPFVMRIRNYADLAEPVQP